MEQEQGPGVAAVRRRDPQTPPDLGDGSVPAELAAARGRACSVLGGKASLPRLTPLAQALPELQEPRERRGWQQKGLWEGEGSKPSLLESHCAWAGSCTSISQHWLSWSCFEVFAGTLWEPFPAVKQVCKMPVLVNFISSVFLGRKTGQCEERAQDWVPGDEQGSLRGSVGARLWPSPVVSGCCRHL